MVLNVLEAGIRLRVWVAASSSCKKNGLNLFVDFIACPTATFNLQPDTVALRGFFNVFMLYLHGIHGLLKICGGALYTDSVTECQAILEVNYGNADLRVVMDDRTYKPPFAFSHNFIK
jgi:hypothetical protein